MPKLLQSIVTVIEVFYQYATKDEECAMLNKGEMKVFLENEFHQIMKVRTLYQDKNTAIPFFSLSTFCHIYQIPR